MSLDRVVIVGKTGAGKSTLGRQLAQIRSSTFVELDAIHWQPNWGLPATEDFQRNVSEACPVDGRWVADGNYSAIRPIVWTRADTIVWLDYPLWLSLWRLFWRTLMRFFWRIELWAGNREYLFEHLTFNDKSLFVFAVRSHSKHRELFPKLLQEEYSHLNVLRFKHPREADAWLKALVKGKQE